MRKLIAILFMIPVLTFSQTEREQKTAIRNNSSVPSTQSSSSIKNYSEASEKINFRDNSRNTYQSTPSKSYTTPSYFSNPYSYNRWYRLGAPSYGYSFYNDWYYYDRFGYRQPARVYVYENGRRDTIKAIKPHFKMGLSFTNQKQLGGWVTIGNGHYFLTEYLVRRQEDLSTFYNDLRMDLVRGWNDQRYPDLIKDNILFLGVGKKFSSFSAHVAIGFGKEIVNYQYYDDLLLLSNNGLYSFPNYNTKYTTAKIGIIKDYNSLSLKGEYDPFRRVFNLGVGVNW